MGATIGTTTKVISIKSRINPSRKITIMTNNMAVNAPPGKSVKKSCSSSSPPNPRKTSEKIDAPISIKNTIDVTFVVSRTTYLVLPTVTVFFISARNTEPMAPTPAASVGVALPVKIEPNTAAINSKGGSKASSNSFKLACSLS